MTVTGDDYVYATIMCMLQVSHTTCMLFENGLGNITMCLFFVAQEL